MKTTIHYDKWLINGESVRPIYLCTGIAFRALFGYLPRQDIETLLSEAWDKAGCETQDDFDKFYRHNLLVTEEVALWHQLRNGERLRRVIHAGTIAKQMNLNSFAEVGAGIGTDGVALARLGFKCKYLAEINSHSLSMIFRLANFALPKPPTVVDLGMTTKELAHPHFAPVDWLYSSDVFEHIRNLEDWLDPWIRHFKAVILYAPFGKSEKNHAHTGYTKKQFNCFMDAQGFEKIKVRGLGIPPMVYRRRI
jgi:hypothetical protein